jgi:hypothetical protein
MVLPFNGAFRVLPFFTPSSRKVTKFITTYKMDFSLLAKKDILLNYPEMGKIIDREEGLHFSPVEASIWISIWDESKVFC